MFISTYLQVHDVERGQIPLLFYPGHPDLRYPKLFRRVAWAVRQIERLFNGTFTTTITFRDTETYWDRTMKLIRTSTKDLCASKISLIEQCVCVFRWKSSILISLWFRHHIRLDQYLFGLSWTIPACSCVHHKLSNDQIYHWAVSCRIKQCAGLYTEDSSQQESQPENVHQPHAAPEKISSITTEKRFN